MYGWGRPAAEHHYLQRNVLLQWALTGCHTTSPPHRFLAGQARDWTDVTWHLPTFLPIFLARLPATAGAEAGLSNLSGKQKFLQKTIAFVAHFPFSHRLLPIVGGISQMVAYVLDAAGLKFKIFHLPGPCLFLKRRFNNRKNNCCSFLPEWHSPSYSVSEAKPRVGSRTVLPLLSPWIWDMGRKEGWAFSAHHPAQGEKMLHLTLKCSDARCFARDSPNRWTAK